MKLSVPLNRLCRRAALPFLLLSLIPFSTCFAAIVPGDLIITEVMANPASVSDTDGEWFEIYNRSGEILDLSGLVIKDAGSNQHTLSGPVSVGANSYFVLGRNADSGTNGGYTADYQYSNFTLGNSADQIILEFDGMVIDSVSYDSGSDFGIAGVSAELTSAGFSATPAGLFYGAGDTGTPGSAGSDPTLDLSAPSAVPLPAAGWLMSAALAALTPLGRRR